MQPLQTEPVTKLQKEYTAILKRLSTGPVMLLQRSEWVAVMVSPEQWNGMIAGLEELRRKAGKEAKKLN